MAIVKMKRLHLLALAKEHDAILRKLQHMGCVEISEPESIPDSLKRCGSAVADCMAQQRQLQTATDALKRLAPKAKAGGLLTPRPQIAEADYLNEADFDEELKAAEEINSLTADLNRLTTRENQLRAERAALAPWQALDIPTEVSGTKRVDITTGTLPPFAQWDAVEGEVAAQCPETALYQLSASKEQQCVVVFSYKAETAQVLELLRSHGFSAGQLKGRTGTVQQQLDELSVKERQAAAEKEETLKKLAGYAGRIDSMQLCADRLATRMMREENRHRLLTDGCIVAFDGWVSAEKLPRLTAWLDTLDCAYDVADPTEEEIPEVPVALKSNVLTRSMNCITEQYSLPAYDGVDPNPVMAPFFIVFFGIFTKKAVYISRTLRLK